MGLLTRLATLLRADAHGVVDALEDKALLLRQHVREAEAELAAKESRLEAFAAEEAELEAEAASVEADQKKLEDDVALALAEGEDELARFAVRKLLPLERRASSIGRRRAALAEESAELAEVLERQRAEYERLEARARAYLARPGHPEGAERCGPEAGWWEPVADEEVEIELLRRKQAAAGKGGS